MSCTSNVPSIDLSRLCWNYTWFFFLRVTKSKDNRIQTVWVIWYESYCITSWQKRTHAPNFCMFVLCHQISTTTKDENIFSYSNWSHLKIDCFKFANFWPTTPRICNNIFLKWKKESLPTIKNLDNATQQHHHLRLQILALITKYDPEHPIFDMTQD